MNFKYEIAHLFSLKYEAFRYKQNLNSFNNATNNFDEFNNITHVKNIINIGHDEAGIVIKYI